MKKYVFIVLLALIIFSGHCLAENENEYFSDPNAMISQNTSPQNAQIQPEDKKSIGFSGELTSAMINSVMSSSSPANSLYTFTVCNIFLDARLKKMMKVFANVETNIVSRTNATNLYVRELFFDFNIKNKVYFRTGKQVLQWGRCYLWNPTDFINVERKPFIRKIGYREGTYGLKMHVPFGTKYNFYSFIDTNYANSPEDAAGSFKFEFLTGSTEMAFSAWLKSQRSPVYGYDLSTRILSLDILGEVSVSKDDLVKRMAQSQGTLITYMGSNDWSPRASLAMTKYFDLGNFNDRVSITNEFFYNGTGYSDDIFADPAKRMFFLANGLYTPNYYAKYYDAVFISVGRFIVTDATFNLNYIRNLCDNSSILSTGVAYKDINDLSLGLLVNSALGGPDKEYTVYNEKFNIQLTLGVSF